MGSSISVRGRLGVSAAIGAGLLAAGTAVSIAAVTWQATSDTLADDVTLATFVAAESATPNQSPLPKTGNDPFLLTIDGSGEIIEETNPVSPQLLSDLLDDVWSLTTIEEEVVLVTYDSPAGPDSGELTVAGLRCVDTDVCDTVIVGTHRESFTSYARSNWAALVFPVLFVAFLAWFGARWLVGRSLRPVEKMRKEVAAITESNLASRVEVPNTGDELTELGETFNQTLGRLDSAVNANERFVADAAHELRSPIAGVRAAVELEEAKNPGSILEDVLVELDRAGRLIDDLLVLARRRGRYTNTFTDVDLDDLVGAEMGSAATRFPEIALSSSVTPVRVRGQADALRRVVSNLVENACAHAHSQVHVVVTEDDNGARIEVQDDGPGIPATDVDRIFERFARLDESRSRATGGSGLGLAIAKEIADDHAASIEVSRSDLGGANFVLRFGTRLPASPPNA